MAWIIRNNVRQKVKHGGEGKLHLEVNIQHDIPKIMFVLLPLFALYVGLLYSRRKYYYVNHAIFSVHFHSFVFLFFLFLLLIGQRSFIPGDLTGKILLASLSKPGVVRSRRFVIPILYLPGRSVAADVRAVGWDVVILKAVGMSLLYISITLSVVSTSLSIAIVDADLRKPRLRAGMCERKRGGGNYAYESKLCVWVLSIRS